MHPWKSLMALVVAGLGSAAPFAQAEDAWTYQGKTLTVYSAGSIGGGYDSYARMLARHIGKYLPGRPTVIVKNMPGAGGIVMLNHLQSRAARDGTEIGAP